MEPRFNERQRDWQNVFAAGRDFFLYLTTTGVRPGSRKSFVIPRTSLYRGSLDRGSTVVKCFPQRHKKQSQYSGWGLAGGGVALSICFRKHA